MAVDHISVRVRHVVDTLANYTTVLNHDEDFSEQITLKYLVISMLDRQCPYCYLFSRQIYMDRCSPSFVICLL